MKHFLQKYQLLFLFVTIIAIFTCFIFNKIDIKNRQINLQVLNDNEWEIIAENAVEKYVGNTLILPHTDSLYICELEYFTINKLPLKVVSFLDGDCSTCLMKISFWKKFISELNSKGYRDIPVVMYASSFFEDNIRDYMGKEWSNHPWLFDANRSFIESNMLYDLRLQTVLLDSENRVILIGDPLLNPKLRELYMKTIISLL